MTRLSLFNSPLLLGFEQFEQADDTNWDGAVVEYSIDEGETWTDVAELADPGYSGTITNRSGNELADRLAYVGQSPSWPAYDEESDTSLLYAAPIATAEGVRKKQCDFWESLR